MGRLAGFKYRDVASKLKELGFAFAKQAKGSHEVWRHADSGRKTTLTHHTGDIPESTLRKILREGGIDVDEFLCA